MKDQLNRYIMNFSLCSSFAKEKANRFKALPAMKKKEIMRHHKPMFNHFIPKFEDKDIKILFTFQSFSSVIINFSPSLRV